MQARAARGYAAITVDDVPRGSSYPFLDGHGRAWSLVRYDLAQEGSPDLLPQDSFGLAEPTLRWVSDSGVTDLYLDGMSTADFLAATGLELSLAKGGYVLSKRLSRLLRSYQLAGHFPASEVRVAYLSQDADQKKVWDGAGLVDRGMLRRLVLSEELDPQQRARLEWELDHATRVEFTLLGQQGQDKGHALVVDELRDETGARVDFLLPQDSKREVRRVDGQTFVGLNIVHGHEQMRLDIQSLIHLGEFFTPERLEGWLLAEGALFTQGVQSGRAGQAMARLDEQATLADVTSWPLREFLVSGGDARWSNSLTRSLIGQHLGRLNDQTQGKLRLPIPGARQYVMPVGVAQRAGRALQVGRGQIHVDPAASTAWVNDEDWLAMADSPQGRGIAAILGGADNDDALWLHGFTDEVDGKRKVLAWRSPNQLGEYIVLEPTPDSAPFAWATPNETLAYPRADSRQLPARVDVAAVQDQGLVDPESAGGVGEGQAYTVEAMQAAVERARMNQGVLGQFCNALLVHKAVYGTLPEDLPASLEAVIDASVKTGADLSAVRAWCYQHSERLRYRGARVPERVVRRLARDPTCPPWALVPPVLKTGGAHALDQLDQGVAAHIQRVEGVRDDLTRRAMPPATLFDVALADPEALKVGAQYNQQYARAVRTRRASQREADLDHQAAEATQVYLAQFTPDERRALYRKRLFERVWREQADARYDAWQQGAVASCEMTAADYEQAVASADLALAALAPERMEQELYEATVRWKQKALASQTEEGLTEADHEAIRAEMESWLARFPEERQRAILRGALAHLYLQEEPGSDAGLWLAGEKTADGRAPGIGHQTICALQEIGLLDEVVPTSEGLVLYPEPEPLGAPGRTVGVRGAWFHWLRVYAEAAGQPVPERMGEVGRAERKMAHAQLERLAEVKLPGEVLTVREEAGALMAYTARGNPLGRISLHSQERVAAGQELLIRGAVAQDGNLHLIID